VKQNEYRDYDKRDRHDYNRGRKLRKRPKHAKLKPDGGKPAKWSEYDNREFYDYGDLDSDG
jgi:hypothetical protein